MVTTGQKQTMGALQIKNFAEMLEPHLAEKKIPRRIKMLIP
jgi:hypothetical protein